MPSVPSKPATADPKWVKVLESVIPGEKPFAVLCGAGVSANAGLILANEFRESVLQACLDRDYRALLSYPNPSIRFEGLLEVIQRVVDSDLACLGAFHPDVAEPTEEHHALAALARDHPVISTNFDVLIEKSAPPPRVVYTEAGFRDLLASPDLVGNFRGLLKIHGTIAVSSGGGGFRILNASEDGGPIITLRSISRTRESPARRAVVEGFLREYALVIVGYSASDDFDVARWLADGVPHHDVIWFQFDNETTDIPLRTAEALAGDARLDPGLVRIAQAWHLNGCDDRLHIVVDSRPVDVLRQLDLRTQGSDSRAKGPGNRAVNLTSTQGSTDREKSRSILQAQLSRLLNGDSKDLLGAAILSHACFFRRAGDLLEGSDNASLLAEQHVKRHVLRAEALIETGYPDRQRGAQEAAQRAETLLATREPTDPWVCALNIVKSKIMRIVDKKGVEAAELLKSMLPTASNWSAEQIAAYVELKRLERLYKNKVVLGGALERVAEKEAPSDLSIQALNDHETAKGDWPVASNSRDVLTSIKHMEKAVALRDQLGDVRGFCASTNVLGSMYHRLADWHGLENADEDCFRGAVDSAFRWYRESLDRAMRYDLIWDQEQVHITLALGFLRLRRDWGSCLWHVAEADRINRDILKDDQETLRLEFLRALMFCFEVSNERTKVHECGSRFAAIANTFGRQEKGKIGPLCQR